MLMAQSRSNFDLRPPLPLDGLHIPADEDGSSSALSPQARLVLRSILSRMYASAEVMQLGSETRFTSLVLFHRYYFASHAIGVLSRQQGGTAAASGGACPAAGSRQDTANACSSNGTPAAPAPYKWREHLGTVAASCLFLGCKVEEEHRRIRDVINLSHMLDFAGERGDTFKGAGTDVDAKCASGEPTNGGPAAAADVTIHIQQADAPPDLDGAYWKAKEAIVATEQEVLRMLRFDVSVSHPHRAVLLILDGLGIDVTGDEGRALVKESFTALNDALFYPPSLTLPTLSLACGAIRLAGGGGGEGKDGSSFLPVHGALLPLGAWWRKFDVSDDCIECGTKSLVRARVSLRNSYMY
jgi:hypothetical protein